MWQDKALYNYYLQYEANTEEEFSERVNKLELIPETDSYIDRFTNKKEQALLNNQKCLTSNKLELMTGFEPVTYALPRRCATTCATSASQQ